MYPTQNESHLRHQKFNYAYHHLYIGQRHILFFMILYYQFVKLVIDLSTIHIHEANDSMITQPHINAHWVQKIEKKNNDNYFLDRA